MEKTERTGKREIGQRDIANEMKIKGNDVRREPDEDLGVCSFTGPLTPLLTLAAASTRDKNEDRNCNGVRAASLLLQWPFLLLS